VLQLIRKIFVSLIAGGFGLMFSFGAIAGLHNAFIVHSAQDWPQINAKTSDCAVSHRKGSSRAANYYFNIELTYRYAVNGVEYARQDRWDLESTEEKNPSIDRMRKYSASACDARSELIVRFDAKNPGDSLRDEYVKAGLTQFLTGLMVSLIAAILLIAIAISTALKNEKTAVHSSSKKNFVEHTKNRNA
jgi:hypothetical protein